MNRQHEAEKSYLGFIQHTWVVSKTGIIIMNSPFYNERHNGGKEWLRQKQYQW